MSQDMVGHIDLLNELEETIGRKRRTVDEVIAASGMLLACALRQIMENGDKAHALDRAHAIGSKLPELVEDERLMYLAFGFGKNRGT